MSAIVYERKQLHGNSNYAMGLLDYSQHNNVIQSDKTIKLVLMKRVLLRSIQVRINCDIYVLMYTSE
jgi:hypothetical protein